jgi:2-polyprenyl-3-methyl-5-hydroxy-6-metoxy-1,4-benzoquinol methylase
MNPLEYTKLAEAEASHWFYSGKRDIVRWWLNRTYPLQPDHLLVDCGAGTGKFAEEIQVWCKVLAVDDHEESLNIARSKLGANRVLSGTCQALPLANNSVDVLTALDVLEHVEDDVAALKEFARVVKKNGVVVITVPALPGLWSDWDVVLHHFRRYTRPKLLRIVQTEQFQVVHCAYINVAALPAVYLIRKIRVLLGKFGFVSTRRSEDQPPPPALNAVLKYLFVKLACQTKVKFPAGVGLLLVLKRR